MTTDDTCFYLQNRLMQTSQTGGQWYSDTSPFSIPWIKPNRFFTVYVLKVHNIKRVVFSKKKFNIVDFEQRAKHSKTLPDLSVCNNAFCLASEHRTLGRCREREREREETDTSWKTYWTGRLGMVDLHEVISFPFYIENIIHFFYETS
jgi:hypothetical protein